MDKETRLVVMVYETITIAASLFLLTGFILISL